MTCANARLHGGIVGRRLGAMTALEDEFPAALHSQVDGPIPYTYHLVTDEDQLFTFCGRLPGPDSAPDREDWTFHDVAEVADLFELVDRTDRRYCLTCALVVKKVIERQIEDRLLEEEETEKTPPALARLRELRAQLEKTLHADEIRGILGRAYV